MIEPEIRGRIDFEAAAGQPLTRVGERAVRGRGVDVRARAGVALALAVDGPRLAVSIGRPRFAPGSPAFVDEAVRWLARWRECGADAPVDVRGPYAVVLVDVSARRALLATDRFAIQPLCYAFDGNCLSFSDRADAVLPPPRQTIDPQAVFDYLYFHVIPAPRTIFEHVSRLRAGHCLSIETERAELRRHWRPVFHETASAAVPELAEEFRRLLREAVARDATGASVGSFLSGGTDSSTVAGMIGELGNGPARTFSIGFDAAGYDELAFARIAARHFGTDHHEYYVTPRDIVAGLPRVAAAYDQPFGNSSALAAYCCAKLAREYGVEVLLAGDGGDELFGGNSRYAKQALFASYEWVPRWLRSGVLEPATLRMPGADRLPLVRKLASFIRQARVPMPDRMNTYNLLMHIGAVNVLEPAFIASIDQEEPRAQQADVYAEFPHASLLNRMLAYDWKFTLADNDLPKVVETTKLAGVAVRFPLLADELVDFSLELAPRLKLNGVRLRYFFKEALRGFLPDEILAKKKHGFGLPFGPWVVQDRQLHEFATESLGYLKDRGIVRHAFLRTLLDARIREHPGYYGEMIWILMTLSEWLRARSTAPAPATAPLAD